MRVGIKVFDCPAADGRIFAFKIARLVVYFIKEIVDVGFTQHLIGVFTRLDDIGDYLVRFIPDVTHKLFKYVLYRDNAHGAAEFIDHNGNMGASVTQMSQCVGQMHRFMQEAGLHKHFAYICIGIVHRSAVVLVQIKNAYYVVYAVLINRNT